MIQLLIVTLMIGLGFVYWHGQKEKDGTADSPRSVEESRSVIDDAERTVRSAENKSNTQAQIETTQ